MNSEQKQEFKSSGVLTLLGLVAFSLSIIASPWNHSGQDLDTEVALQKAEVVGYQVVQIYREAAKSSSASVVSKGGRNPASLAPVVSLDSLRTTGTMGTDPWGHAYHYRVLSAEPAKNIRILVWSAGPNGKIETADLDDENKKVMVQPKYEGDDIGVVLSMSQN
ncbi:MAG: hypothetical protein ACM3MG_03575 [Bacillota bacterium]